MPPFRIPFTTRKPAPLHNLESNNEENTRPGSIGGEVTSPYRPKPSLALGIKGSTEEPNEFKMSAVNDSGEYLPPSPTEKKSFWHKSPQSTTSSNHRSMLSENEPFSISRESFESYRRSFDISGRSPVLQGDGYQARASLDSRSPRLTRPIVKGNTFERPSATQEEAFEEVGLHDDPKPKKRSFLSKAFGDQPSENPPTPADSKSPLHHHFHLPGRKRGQSGTGSELGNMERPSSRGK